MSPSRPHLLYVYADRIPADLRELVWSYLSQDEFNVDTMTYSTPVETMHEKMTWADVVLFAPGRHLADEVLASGQNIKLMQLWSSGYDKFNLEGATRCGIPVANNGGANAVSVAEHTILLMLAAYKRFPDSYRRTVEGNWAGNSHGMDMFLLHEKTLGLVGFGNIAREVARRARGFGMKIVYTDPRPAGTELELELGARRCSLEELLDLSDIVSLHLHHTEETAGIIGAEQLDRMKGSAVLINVSRAGLVDQDALLGALEEGRIAGLGLDVYPVEPTEAGDPILTHPNVVATPHVAGSTNDIYHRVLRGAIQNFRRVLADEPPLWVVNDVSERSAEPILRPDESE